MELYRLTASELSRMMQKKEVSSAEITRSVFGRIAQKEPEIEAYITLDEEGALKKAAEVDEKRAKGESLPPLAGIPVGIKDNICLKGLPATCASKMLQNFVPPYNATVIEKLNAQDCVYTGKTTLDEVVWYDSTTANTVVEEGVKDTAPVTFNVTTPVEYMGKAVTMYVEKTTILANSKVIGVATNDEMNVINATVETEDTVKDYLKGTGVAVDADTDYYVNYGYCENAEEATSIINEYANTVFGTSNTNFALNGIEVEVIDNNDDGKAEYVLYLMETLSLVNRYNDRAETLTFYAPKRVNGNLTLESEPVVRDFDNVVFEDEVATDDLILYVEYGGRTYVKLPEIVTGTMTRVDRDKDDQLYITVNDETYYQSYIPDAASMTDVDIDHFDIDEARTLPGFDTEYDFILDSNGFVVAIRPAEEVVTNYALVLGSAWTQNALTRSGEVEILKADGTKSTYTINWNKSVDAFETITDIGGTTVFADEDAKLETYLGSKDVHNANGDYTINNAKGSVITYSLNSDETVLTIESVLQGNARMMDVDADYTGTDETLDIQSVRTDSTAGVGDNGVVIYLDTNPFNLDECNMQYVLNANYTNGSGEIKVAARDDANNYGGNPPTKTYAVDRNTVAFYYYTVYEKGEEVVKYGVATGWQNMSNVTAGEHVQVYPVLSKNADHTYKASNLADLILFEAEPITTAAQYMLVLDANAKTKDLWELNVVFEDGTVDAITVGEDDLGDLDPEVEDDFMRAYTYVENADGTYNVGDTMDGHTFRGEAYLLEDGTIDYADGDLTAWDRYWAIHSDAHIWDVNDVENAEDEALAGAFNRTPVYTVIVTDSDGVRTAWYWAIPGTPVTPTPSSDIQVLRSTKGLYTDATFYVEDPTKDITFNEALNALLAKMKDDGCTDISVMQWSGDDTYITYTYGEFTRALSIDNSVMPDGTGTPVDAGQIALRQVYKLTVDNRLVGYFTEEANIASEFATKTGEWYREGSTYTMFSDAIFDTMGDNDRSIETGYYRFYVDNSSFASLGTTNGLAYEVTSALDKVTTGSVDCYYGKSGTLSIVVTSVPGGSVNTNGNSVSTDDTIVAGSNASWPGIVTGKINTKGVMGVGGDLALNSATDTVTFTDGAAAINYSEFVVTFTWTLNGVNDCVPTLTVSGLTVAP